MATKFSADGKYFAQISVDGKLKIWNTLSNSFEQEFIPDFHLTAPCTCLHFLYSEPTTNKASPSPKKKKRKNSLSNTSPSIVLGTTSGILLVYSISKGELDFTINSDLNQPISCLSSSDSVVIYTGAEQNICQWDLSKKSLKSKWKGGNEKISSILVLPDSNRLLTASKIIKLWDVNSKEVLRNFTGHSSDVIFLHYVNPKGTDAGYVLSGSKGDRLLNVWNLENNKDKNAVASFLMEDVVQNVSVNIANDDSTNIAATVRSGVVHVYQQRLNGKCAKPLKPKTTIQVVSDTGQNQDVVRPIRIVGALYRDDETLCIGYGSEVLQNFENITLCTYTKVQCLIRKDPSATTSAKQDQVSKTHTPVVGNDVHYFNSQTATLPSTIKRKNDGQMEVPMEQRLENLTLNKVDSNSKVPKVDNVAQLLVQGLHSKDKNILRTALCKRDDNIVRNTVKRLPVIVFEPLIKELSSLIHSKTLSSQIGALWLRHISQIHAGILMSNPDLPELLGSALRSIDSRVSLQTPLRRLKGKLDLLLPQISLAEDTNEKDDAVLVFNDKESSDSDMEDMQLDIHSESENENEWDEFSGDENGLNETQNHDDDDENSEDSEVIMIS